MDYFSIPKVEPSIIFPEGAVIEDVKGIYKILKLEKQGVIHKYQVEVLEQKIPIPEEIKFFMKDEKFQTILVLPQNLDKIKRIA
jgi:hypothetical protein